MSTAAPPSSSAPSLAPAVRPGAMREAEWLIPGFGLTFFSALFALTMIPDHSGIMPALRMLPFWLGAAALVGGFHGLFRLVAEREPSPLGRIARFGAEDWRMLLFVAACFLLTGLNMIAFMWIKPLLNYLVPFWADPMLADLDRLLFLGHDPWGLLTALNNVPTAIFYHRGWFAMMILTLLVVVLAPPSPEKSATMLTYFLLWSVAGPLIHSLLPAAGPIFYDDLGYGDRFTGLTAIPQTEQVADYLWALYASEGFGPGSGISAMPSLHIATTAWMILAVRRFAPRWNVPMAAAGALIFLLSMSLGWHYAVDGIVGAAATILCYRLALQVYRRAPRRVPGAVPAA